MINARAAVAMTRSPRAPAAALLLIGVILAVATGFFASQGHDRLTLTMALAVPITILLMRYPWSAVLLWLGLTPFFVQGDGMAGPDTWLLHRLLIPTVLVLSLAYRMLGLSKSHFRLSVTDVAIVAFLFLGLANVQLLSGNPTRMSVAFYDSLFIPIALYWLVRVIDPRDKELRRLLVVMVLLVLTQAAIGALSWVAPGILPGAWLGRAGERGAGSLGGPGPYTVTLMVGAAYVMPFLARSRSTLVRAALFGVVAIAFAGVAISFSRGSWLGAAAVLTGLAIAFPGVVVRLAAAGALVGAILVAGPLSAQADFAVQRFGDEDTAVSRLVTNNAAVRMIQERPAMGFGYGNFEAFDESFKVRFAGLPVQEGSAHHAYLALAAENGLPALGLYLFPAAWLLGLTVSRWRVVTARDALHRPMLIVLWLAVIDQAIVMNFMDMLHSSAWGTALWWLSLGLIHVIITRGSRPPEVRRMGWTLPPPT